MTEILENVKEIVNEFTRKKIKIATAESCTGGYISHIITNISGASKVFERGIVCYSNEAKIEMLDVTSESIDKFGAVSEQVVRQMANNIRIIANVDIGISISGIAGPTGGTKEKPVGLVYIGYSTKTKTVVIKRIFKTNRINFKREVLKEILKFLKNFEV